jgi:hypothetical protein
MHDLISDNWRKQAKDTIASRMRKKTKEQAKEGHANPFLGLLSFFYSQVFLPFFLWLIYRSFVLIFARAGQLCFSPHHWSSSFWRAVPPIVSHYPIC